ncbi:hypothetical protein [Streptomyces sp. NPDC014676]|uniref:hypothetical protein n=1 Tax=Streptomyces sp. NPDC014676 TaxID=3364879 RepID=UPI0036FBA6E2
MIDMFADLYDPRDAAGNRLSGEDGRREQVAWVRDFRAQWEFIDSDLRPRAVQASIEWVPHQWSGRVKGHLDALDPRVQMRLEISDACEAFSHLAAVSQRLRQLYG